MFFSVIPAYAGMTKRRMPLALQARRCVMAMDKIKNCMKISAQANGASTALLVVRLLVGIALMIHGWGKIQNPFGWMSPDSPVPGILQFLAAISQFGGGAALIAGLLTRLASLGLLITMMGADVFHLAKGHPFVASGLGQPSYEIATLYFAISLIFLLIGPGKFSADAKIFGTN